MAKLRHRLIVVTDAAGCPRPLAAQVARALRGGPFALLLRDKHLPWSRRRDLAERLEGLLAAAGGELLVADPPEAVRAAHLSARRPVPEPRPACLGRSVHAGAPVPADLDYITYSPIWATDSKPGYGPAVGIEGLAERAAASPVPVYALGGVTGPDRALAARRAGAAGAAVMGAVMRSNEPERVVAALRTALEDALAVEPVRGDDLGVELRAGLGDALLGRVVDVDQAEALVVAEGPLEVVHQRPGGVAAHVGALLDRVVDRGDVRPQVVDPLGVDHLAVRVGLGRVGRAVLGDHRRHAVVLVDAHQEVGQAGGVDRPAHVRHRQLLGDPARDPARAGGDRALGRAGDVLDPGGVVVVDAHQVDRL